MKMNKSMQCMKWNILILVFILIFTCVRAVFPDSTPGEDTEITRGVMKYIDNTANIVKLGKQYLLLIGINKYNYWPPLKNPVKDARELGEILTSQYLIDETIELYDEQAGKANILSSFQYLQEKLGVDDSLIIFYAGHGYLDESVHTGYWLPVDAGIDPVSQANWMPNSQIRGLISSMESSHILLIVDSCFSGDILQANRSGIVTIDNEYFLKAYDRISRQVITSGAIETVPDESEFAFQLKMALKKNRSAYIDPIMLYNNLRLGMTKSIPLLGELKDTGHQQGASFILFLKDAKEVGVTTIQLSPLTNPSITHTDIIKQEQPSVEKTITAMILYDMAFPLGEVGDTLETGHNAGARVYYNFSLPLGIVGFGITTGFQMESTEDWVPYAYTLFLIPAMVNFVYKTSFLHPFFLSLGGGGGIIITIARFAEEYSGLSDSITVHPGFDVHFGPGYYVTDTLSIWVFGEFSGIFYTRTFYTEAGFGLGMELSF